MSARARTIFISLAAALLAGGCTTLQSAMNPAGVQAQRVSGLWWFFLSVGVGVYVITMIFVFLALRRRRRGGAREDLPEPPVIENEPAQERRLTTVVSVSMAITIVVLIVLLIAEFSTTRAVAALSGDKTPVKIRVTARQWWWEGRYEDKTTSEIVTTANEFHIPVGRTIQFELQATDVIHSFWVPNLSGKKDMIPGHGATLFLRADKPGTYYGQCAEFCGYQHAKMRFVVVAESPDDYEKWRSRQLQPPNEPASLMEIRGRQVFQTSTCPMCHTVGGTNARGTVGPNLTHVASRWRLAAGSIPNRPGHLAGWITDPQKIKPGVRMPQHQFDPQDLRALLEYLESLK
jgi:cytochrome c oxidase subunit 2